MRFRYLFFVLFYLLLSQNSFAAERRTAIVDAVAKARGAVVNIRTEQIVQRRGRSLFGFGDSLFDQFFREMLPPRSYRTQSLGSGVIIDSAGHVLTNAHVVDKASRIFVALTGDSREIEAELIGKDNRVDLAVLKIKEPGDYSYLTPATSADLMLGETVIAIGNPLGLGHSITTGIVSSSQRRIQVSDTFSSVFIQTDALINPGNSGGPLININGDLIGINTAIARQAQGIGFSIPIDTAKRVVDDLLNYGRVRRGFLGLLVGEVSPAFVSSYGTGGVLVENVVNDSPAASAGLRPADVILAMDRVPIAAPDDYLSLMQTYTPGDPVELTILRGVEKFVQSVSFGDLPKGYELSYTRKVFGMILQQGQRGVYIDQVVEGSAAERVGLKRGDFVTRVEYDEIESIADFEQAIEARLGQKPLTFTIVRNNVGYLVELP